MTTDVEVIDEARRARILLKPPRPEILELLGVPASASTLAADLGVPRQRLNYHLRELERAGLIRVAAERRNGNSIERTYQRLATTFAISGHALGSLSPSPEAVQDRFSAAYQVAMASRTIQDLGRLQTQAAKAGKSLPTFALEVDVRFPNAQSRAAFTDKLTRYLASLVQEHHDGNSPSGRTFRFHLGAYQRPTDSPKPLG